MKICLQGATFIDFDKKICYIIIGITETDRRTFTMTLNETHKLQIILGLYALFGIMGLWLGVDAYTEWYERSERLGFDSLWTPDQMFLLTCMWIAGLVATYPALFMSNDRQDKETDFYGRLINSFWRPIAPGAHIAGALGLYSYSSGTLHESGDILDPWLILPMFAVLTIVPLVYRLIAGSKQYNDSTQNSALEES